jgi:hypothetical protein
MAAAIGLGVKLYTWFLAESLRNIRALCAAQRPAEVARVIALS